VIDHLGEQWGTVDEAARDARVRPGTIRVWITRGTIRAHRIGAHRFVSMVDVRHAEAEWRKRLTCV